MGKDTFRIYRLSDSINMVFLNAYFVFEVSIIECGESLMFLDKSMYTLIHIATILDDLLDLQFFWEIVGFGHRIKQVVP